MPDFLDFGELLKRHLDALAKADEFCRAAAEKRREVLRDAQRVGINISLLKLIAREQHLDPEVREELREYREAVTAFERTPLGAAARAPEEAEVEAEARRRSTAGAASWAITSCGLP
jgi:hypothetical protein